MELLAEATDGIDFDDTRGLAQLGAHDPVLNRPQPHRIVCRFAATADGIHEDLAQSGRDRAHCRLDAFRQTFPDLGEPLIDQLPGQINIGAIMKDHSHLRQAVARQRARVVQTGQTGHGRFDQEGDPLLRFQR